MAIPGRRSPSCISRACAPTPPCGPSSRELPQVRQRPVDIGFVALAGHTLLLATGEDGLGYLDIREWVANGPRTESMLTAITGGAP